MDMGTIKHLLDIYGKKKISSFWLFSDATNDSSISVAKQEIFSISVGKIKSDILAYEQRNWFLRWMQRLFTNIEKKRALYIYFEAKQWIAEESTRDISLIFDFFKKQQNKLSAFSSLKHALKAIADYLLVLIVYPRPRLGTVTYSYPHVTHPPQVITPAWQAELDAFKKEAEARISKLQLPTSAAFLENLKGFNEWRQTTVKTLRTAWHPDKHRGEAQYTTAFQELGYANDKIDKQLNLQLQCYGISLENHDGNNTQLAENIALSHKIIEAQKLTKELLIQQMENNKRNFVAFQELHEDFWSKYQKIEDEHYERLQQSLNEYQKREDEHYERLQQNLNEYGKRREEEFKECQNGLDKLDSSIAKFDEEASNINKRLKAWVSGANSTLHKEQNKDLIRTKSSPNSELSEPLLPSDDSLSSNPYTLHYQSSAPLIERESVTPTIIV